ncbi:MAG: flippase-like domain-containing protein [Anaerolineae bacterium]|nr:flippase-like domain-containing protein [Anaerolineae bacterium]
MKQHYRRLLILLVLSVLIIWGLFRLGNIELNAATLTKVDWNWLLLAFVMFYSGIFVRGLRWQRILKTMGWSTGYGYMQALLMSGFFLSLILPARLGDVARVGMLKQDHKIPIAQGIASLAAERALDVFAILILAIIGAMWALPGRVPSEIWQLIAGAAILLVVCFLGLLAVPGLERWLRHPGQLETRVPVKIWSIYQKILDFGFSMVYGIRTLGRYPLTLAVAILESFYIWLCDVLIIYLGLLSVGATALFSVSLFAGMVSDLVVAVPLTPGGLGQFELVLIWLLTQFEVTTAQASLTVLLVRFIGLWSFLPMGAMVTYIFGFSRLMSLTGKETGETTEETSSTPSLPKPAES